MTIYIGKAVVEKEYEVDAPDEVEAKNMIYDIADMEYPNSDIMFVKEVERVG